MSNTYRHKQKALDKIRYANFIYVGITSWYVFIHSGPKIKRKVYNAEMYNYGSTPGWWVHMTMTKRRRREIRMFESTIKYSKIKFLEYFEPPANWKKPHVYYW